MIIKVNNKETELAQGNTIADFNNSSKIFTVIKCFIKILNFLFYKRRNFVCLNFHFVFLLELLF